VDLYMYIIYRMSCCKSIAAHILHPSTFRSMSVHITLLAWNICDVSDCAY